MTSPYLILIFLGFLANLFHPYYSEIDASVSLIIIGLVLICLLITVLSKFPRPINYIVLIGLTIRLLLLFVDCFGREFIILPQSGGDTELFYYESFSTTPTHSYSVFLRAFFNLVGDQRLLAQFLNLLFSISTIYLLYKLLKLLEVDKKIIQIAIFILCFSPHYCITSVILLRESVNVFLFAASFYCFMKWLITDSKLDFLLACLCCCAGAYFHSGVIAPVIAYAIFFILYSPREKKVVFTPLTIFYSLIVIGGFLFVIAYAGDEIFSKFGDENNVINELTEDKAGDGGAGYNVGIEIGNPLISFLVNSPIRAFYFLFSPMPWNIRGVGDILAILLSSSLYIFTFYKGVKAFRSTYCLQKTIVLATLLTLIGTSLVFGMGVQNAGTAIRHREKFLMPLIFLLAYSQNSLNIAKSKVGIGEKYNEK